MMWVRASIVIALTGTYFWSVFQFSGGTFSTRGLGDWIDPYFINALLEHWYQSVRTFSDPLSPPMFFPERDTLGYSHGLILYAPFYLAVRPFVHPFEAYTLTLFLVLLLGSISLYLLLRRIGVTTIEAILLAACFATSPNIINGSTSTWTQTASVFLIPPILLMLVVAAGMRDGRVRLVVAWLAGLFATSLFTQDFYTAQFALLLTMMALVGVVWLAPTEVRRVVAAAGGRDWVRTVWRTFAAPRQAPRDARPGRWRWSLIVATLSFLAAAIIFVHPLDRTPIGPLRVSARDPFRPLFVGLIAFAWYAHRRWQLVTRLARAASASKSSVSSALRSLSATPEGAMVTAHRRFLIAAAFGAIVGALLFLRIYLATYLARHVFPHDQLLNGLWQPDPARWTGWRTFAEDLQRYQSFRPFALALLLGVSTWLTRIRGGRRYALWCLCVSAVILMMPFKFGTVSAWEVCFGWLPGMSPIRDPKRLIYLYELAVVMLGAFVLRRLPARSLSRILSAAAIAILLAATWNRGGRFEFERDRRIFSTWVEAPLQIDPSCRSFFIVKASDHYMSRSGHMWTLYGIDALFIAFRHGIPTLNGYSAWMPEEWHLANPQDRPYREDLAKWIARHDLHDVCALDIERRTMTPAAK